MALPSKTEMIPILKNAVNYRISDTTKRFERLELPANYATETVTGEVQEIVKKQYLRCGFATIETVDNLMAQSVTEDSDVVKQFLEYVEYGVSQNINFAHIMGIVLREAWHLPTEIIE